MNKEELLLTKRMIELANQAYHRGYPTYTDFLNLNEISIFLSIRNQLPSISYEMSGGYLDAERVQICFYDSYIIEQPQFEIGILTVIPNSMKYCDTLTHRDYLGAILNLGIKRSLIGDIIIKDQIAYVYCKKDIIHYIEDNLIKIKHTNVHCQEQDDMTIDVTPEYKEISGSISSERLDAIVALAFQTSRSSIVSLIAGGKVYVNGKLIESNAYSIKDGDVISVRGHGKFKYNGIKNTTRKGRLTATVLRYI